MRFSRGGEKRRRSVSTRLVYRAIVTGGPPPLSEKTGRPQPVDALTRLEVHDRVLLVAVVGHTGRRNRVGIGVVAPIRLTSHIRRARGATPLNPATYQKTSKKAAEKEGDLPRELSNSVGTSLAGRGVVGRDTRLLAARRQLRDVLALNGNGIVDTTSRTPGDRGRRIREVHLRWRRRDAGGSRQTTDESDAVNPRGITTSPSSQRKVCYRPHQPIGNIIKSKKLSTKLWDALVK
jgi:hypothetical protein